MSALARLAAWCENPKTFEYPGVDDVLDVIAVTLAARDLVEAIDAFHEFEKENPNNSTKHWDAVFEAKNDAENDLRRALAEIEKGDR